MLSKASYSKNFSKQYDLLPPKIRQKVDQRIILWHKDPFNPQLRNHQLQGKYQQYRSINITGDLRALYLSEEDKVTFDLIGSHSQLYG